MISNFSKKNYTRPESCICTKLNSHQFHSIKKRAKFKHQPLFIATAINLSSKIYFSAYKDRQYSPCNDLLFGILFPILPNYQYLNKKIIVKFRELFQYLTYVTFNSIFHTLKKLSLRSFTKSFYCNYSCSILSITYN